MDRSDALEDVKGKKLFKLSKEFYDQGDYNKALEVIEDLSSFKGKNKSSVAYLQGLILRDLARKTENNDLKFTYWLGTVEIYATRKDWSGLAAISLFLLAQQLESLLYYKKALDKAKQSEDQSLLDYMKRIIKVAELKIAKSKDGTNQNCRVKDSEHCEQEGEESEETEEKMKTESPYVKGLRSYWAGLNVEQRRNFMKVSIVDFKSFVQRVYGTEGRNALEKALSSARKGQKWRLWICRSCSVEFSSAEEFKNHVEREHEAGFKPHCQRISKTLCSKISDGGWEPVDTVAAVAMIKNRFDHVKAFAYKNGWSKDWPLASDEERFELPQEIRSLLVRLCQCNILSCSVIDWVMDLVVSHLEKLEVSKHSLTECGLVETPQSICFLECPELNQILGLLERIKYERNDGTELVCRAVDSFYNGTRVKEKIDFDMNFSSLLLDKSLLQCKISQFDDEGTINILNANAHYAKAHARGDDILSWLTEKSSGDEKFRFPRPIRARNLDVWVAVLRAVQFTYRTLGSKYYEKKVRVEYIIEGLKDVKNLCIGEDERRKNIPKDEWKTYASHLCDTCEKMHLTADAFGSPITRMFITVVGDVLKGVLHPTFDLAVLDDCMNVIRDHKNVSDDVVLKSIDHLQLAMTRKVPLIDSKIFLVENSRTNMLNDLARVSVFDYRSYILRPLKEFLLERIVDMESKAKVAAAQADLLLEEEMKSQPKKKKTKTNKGELAAAQGLKLLSENKLEKENNSGSKKKKQNNSGSKKKKRRDKKRTSTAMSEILDQNVEQAEEDSMEHVISNTDNQEEAAKDMQIMPEEDALSKDLEPAHGEGLSSRYNSALDMTLKALCNIKVLKECLVRNRNQSHDNLEERVPGALGNLFTAFVSKQIKEEGVYSCLLSDLVASLEEVCSMSSYAPELLVAILEFWPCWKSPEIESVVTSIFTLEEYERKSCSKCRKTPNYPEQSSYGIVMAADSIRDLKCAFGNMKFEDILKLFRMEDEMLCDIKTGGCGKANFVHHIISRCPPVFSIVLEWEKDETEKEISETTKALDWEIDMSRLYEGLEPNTKYRLVSMIGCGEAEEHTCLAYKKNRWVSFRHRASGKEVVGNWNRLVRFCGERKIRPEVLFYEALQWPNK